MSRRDFSYQPRQYSSPERAQGMTGLHRDMRGNIIGGYAPNGTPLGSRAKIPQTSVTPRLDAGPQTPGLDMRGPRIPQTSATPEVPNGPQAAPQGPFRKYVRLGDGATAAAAQGSQLLKDRQKLFDDMTAAGPELGTDLAARAKNLGVAESTFRKVGQTLGKRFATPTQQGVPPMLARPESTAPAGWKPEMAGPPKPDPRREAGIQKRLRALDERYPQTQAAKPTLAGKLRSFGNTFVQGAAKAGAAALTTLAKAPKTSAPAAPAPAPAPGPPKLAHPPEYYGEIMTPQDKATMLDRPKKAAWQAEYKRKLEDQDKQSRAKREQAEANSPLAKTDFGAFEGTGFAATARFLTGGGWRAYKRK